MKNIDYIDDLDTWVKSFSFYVTIAPRFSETDMFGHVNNTSIFIYFEQARIEFMKKVGMFLEADTSQTIPIVADLQCDYLKQLFFNDQIKLYVKIHQIGKTSFDLHYLGMNQDQEICITGRGRMVQINPTSGKPVAFDETMTVKLNSI